LLFFFLFSKIHLYYEPSVYDHAHSAYAHLLTPAPRLVAASMLTFLIVQQCDARAYRFWRTKFPHFSPLLANALIMCASQGLDTVLFVFLGLWGMVSAVGEILLVTYSIKLLAILCVFIFSVLTRPLLRKAYVV